MDASGDFGDWSGMARKSTIFFFALEKSRSLFPSLSGNFFSKKASAKAKKGSSIGESTDGKRKEPTSGDATEETVKKPFDVNVPKELAAGDTFYTSVKVGETTQKIKLKVPEGNPATLRFYLSVPKESSQGEKQRKKSRPNED